MPLGPSLATGWGAREAATAGPCERGPRKGKRGRVGWLEGLSSFFLLFSIIPIHIYTQERATKINEYTPRQYVKQKENALHKQNNICSGMMQQSKHL
jgi:hypothetical protein